VFLSRFMPCSDCGASIDRMVAVPHVCDPDQRAEFSLRPLRQEIDSFESLLHEYLAGVEGKFETWMAARQVRRAS